jgi:intein/homing endonuclease
MKVGSRLKRPLIPIYDVKDISVESEDYKNGIFAGWTWSDGHLFPRNDSLGWNFGLCFGINEFDVAPYFESTFGISCNPHSQSPDTCLEFRSHNSKYANKLFAIGYNADKSDLTWMYGKTANFKLGFIRAAFTADGSVRKSNNVELYSIHRTALEILCNILREFGIASTVCLHNNAKSYVAKDGKMRNNSTCWKLNVYAGQFKKIGMLSKFKQEKLNSQIVRKIYRYSDYAKVLDIELNHSIEDVYDISVHHDSHTFLDGGIISHNCGEIQLRSNSFCNLSEIVAREDDDIDTMLEKVETATWMGMIQACFTDFPYLNERWKKNCEEERLLGVSITGQMDAPHLFTEEALKAYKAKAIKIAKKASDIMSVSMPAAITCVKPSGCQTADTVLITSEGILSLEEIGDIYGPTWQDHDFEVPQENGSEKSTKFFVNGKHLVKKINMLSGVSLTGTLNHKYRALVNGDYVWKTAEDISVGDIVPYRIGGYTGGSYQKLVHVGAPYHNCKNIKQPELLTEDLAFLLGLYIGDGSNHKKGIRIAGDVNKQECLLKAKKIALDLFGIVGIIYERADGNNADLYLNSTHLLSFFSVNNLLKPDTYNVDIPLIIRKSTPSVINSFIEGYIEADGCMTDEGPAICTVSEKMVKSLPIVLRAISKNCSVKLMPSTSTSWGTKMRYRITITNGRSGNYLMDRKNKSAYEQLDKLSLTNLIPDRVISVEYFEAETYDIEVPVKNTFVANSYISHNTVSQLVNSASGLHRRMFRYQIRRYRIAASDPLFKLVRDQGLPVSPENGQRKQDYVKAQRLYDSMENKIEAMSAAKSVCQLFGDDGWSADKVNTWVVSFPMAAPKDALIVEDCNAIEQLEWYKKIQKNWCEHNASITVYVKPDEWLSVGDWIYKNWDIVNGISFLPQDDHIYEQAPNEKLTKEEYEKIMKTFPKIDYSQLAKYEQEDNTEGAKSLACVSGSCDI